MNLRNWLFLFLFFVGIFSFSEPPLSVPEEYYSEFTMEGKIPVSYYYRNDSYSGEDPLIYDFDTIELLKKRVFAKEENYYGATDSYLYLAFHRFFPYIRGKKIAILGSTVPWYESVVMAYGGFPVTIEYNKIISKHPDLRVMTVTEYEKQPELFDTVVSISSFEHDGLGRYGDPINPNGDLIAMEKTKKMLRLGGILFLAVPIGKDLLAWNAHRVYGPKRLPILLAGWKVLGAYGFHESDFLLEREGHQPVFVLQKIME